MDPTAKASAEVVNLMFRIEQEREAEYMYALCREFPGAVNCRGGRIVIDEHYQSPPDRIIPKSIRDKFGRRRRVSR